MIMANLQNLQVEIVKWRKSSSGACFLPSPLDDFLSQSELRISEKIFKWRSSSGEKNYFDYPYCTLVESSWNARLKSKSCSRVLYWGHK